MLPLWEEMLAKRIFSPKPLFMGRTAAAAAKAGIKFSLEIILAAKDFGAGR